jgi:hypothetical protein
VRQLPRKRSDKICHHSSLSPTGALACLRFSVGHTTITSPQESPASRYLDDRRHAGRRRPGSGQHSPRRFDSRRPPKNANERAEELVRGAGEEVAAPGLHVNRRVMGRAKERVPTPCASLVIRCTSLTAPTAPTQRPSSSQRSNASFKAFAISCMPFLAGSSSAPRRRKP